MRPTLVPEEKKEQRDKIARDIKEFKVKGGKVQKLSHGAKADDKKGKSGAWREGKES
jgi:hypothetical protein